MAAQPSYPRPRGRPRTAGGAGIVTAITRRRAPTPRRARRRAGAAALACLLLVAGCGSQPPPSPPPERPETFDRRPPLPAGWTRTVNRAGGFSFGLPAGWRASSRGGTTLVRSPGGAVSASVVADRSADGRSRRGLADYASRTARGLSGYRGLRIGVARPLARARYPTVVLRATGTYAQTRVRQAILLAAVRRPGQVTFSLLFFRSAAAPAAAYDPLALRMVRSLRGQPPEF
jgi:hypothetical protein